MITYEPINPSEAKIFFNGEQVGWLEKPYGTYYNIELKYCKLYIPANKKHLVTETISKACKRLHKREVNEWKKLQLLRDSIINKNPKILE